jgi:hypothetical protein
MVATAKIFTQVTARLFACSAIGTTCLEMWITKNEKPRAKSR